jgi:hypothetical protein
MYLYVTKPQADAILAYGFQGLKERGVPFTYYDDVDSGEFVMCSSREVVGGEAILCLDVPDDVAQHCRCSDSPGESYFYAVISDFVLDELGLRPQVCVGQAPRGLPPLARRAPV